MHFWSGTPSMRTAEVVAVARMFDEAGYDGLICSDHLIYPRELSPPHPDSPTGRPGWLPETPWPDSRAPIERFAETIIAKVRG